MDDLPLEIIYHFLSFTQTYKDAISLSESCKLFKNSLDYLLTQKDVAQGIKHLKSLRNIRLLYYYSMVFSSKIEWIPLGYLDLEIGTDGINMLIKHKNSVHHLNQISFDFWIRNLFVKFCHKHECLTIEFYDASPDDCTRFLLNIRFWPKIQECWCYDYREKYHCLLCESTDYDKYFIDNNMNMKSQ